ncbi:MAG: hypothetical protein R3F61_27575 [Myxococcota bacterium]
MSGPVWLDWPKPGVEGVLLVGFARVPTAEERTAIEAACPVPFDLAEWLGPLLRAFDDDMEGEFRARTGRDLATRVGAALDEMHAVVPVSCAYGYSGRRSKPKPDPAFAAAWAGLWARLPTREPRGDGFVEVRPDLFDAVGGQLAAACGAVR